MDISTKQPIHVFTLIKQMFKNAGDYASVRQLSLAADSNTVPGKAILMSDSAGNICMGNLTNVIRMMERRECDEKQTAMGKMSFSDVFYNYEESEVTQVHLLSMFGIDPKRHMHPIAIRMRAVLRVGVHAVKEALRAFG